MNTKTNNKLVDFASFLKQEQDKEYFKNINKQLNLEYKNYQIYPQKEEMGIEEVYEDDYYSDLDENNDNN